MLIKKKLKRLYKQNGIIVVYIMMTSGLFSFDSIDCKLDFFSLKNKIRQRAFPLQSSFSNTSLRNSYFLSENNI